MKYKDLGSEYDNFRNQKGKKGVSVSVAVLSNSVKSIKSQLQNYSQITEQKLKYETMKTQSKSTWGFQMEKGSLCPKARTRGKKG